jgi:cytoskeletal protein CcmA (bactofilin family)
MFGGKRNEPESSLAKSGSGLIVNIISSGTTFEGKAQAEADIRIDGNFKGQLNCKAKLIIGPSGKFDGDVQCVNAVVEGTFSGRMKVLETLEVKENGQVRGEILTKKLVVQAGAIFDVQCDMGGNPAKTDTDKPKINKPEASIN